MSNTISLPTATVIIEYLQSHGIDPILYGSLGASLYLGDFKIFSDIDFLIEGVWLHNKWPELQKLMKDFGFVLVDEHEHEFRNDSGVMVAFADETVLVRDKVVAALEDITNRPLNGLKVRTLTPEQFKQAYSFSEKDGYRKNTRGKKDRHIIELLDAYLQRDIN
jgi:hypothetical protein